MAIDSTQPSMVVASSALPAGAATSANQDTAQTALDAIKTAVEIIDNGVAGSEFQVDVVSSALPAGAATAAAQTTAQTALDAIKVAAEILDNFISGARGLVTEDNSAAIAASLSVLDDWDETNRAAVNPIAGQVGVQGASGAATALTQRVVLATDVALPAGTNAIGKLAANSGVDIGDVDVTSCALPTGASTAAKQPALGTAGAASTDVITIQGIASGTVVPISVATLPSHAVTNAGTFATQNNGHGKTLLSTGGSAASSGDNTLVAAHASLKHKICAFSLSTVSATAVTCIFQSGASGTELWRVVLQAATSTSTGANLAVAAPSWLFETAAATLLNLNLSGAITVHWSVSYFAEA